MENHNQKKLSAWNIYWETLTTKYMTFNGKARRDEFWIFLIIGNGISLLLGIFVPPIAPLYALIMLPPTIAIYVRRIRDTGLSGHWGWILIPLIFPIFIIGFLPKDSISKTFNSIKKGTGTLTKKSKSNTMNNQADTLLKYHEMLKKGIISQAEFDKIKQELIQ
jgi:uncharacterized membrane protein YhaH (DUF805 family)